VLPNKTTARDELAARNCERKLDRANSNRSRYDIADIGLIVKVWPAAFEPGKTNDYHLRQQSVKVNVAPFIRIAIDDSPAPLGQRRARSWTTCPCAS
jgi:hypothetical protein